MPADPPAATPLQAGERERWVHLTLTHTAGEWRLYVDGQRRATEPGPAAEVFDAPWAIGRRGPLDAADQRHFVGDISDVRVYDEALSDAEVAALAAGAL